MVSDLENITEKAAKLLIEPFFDTNWSDMPDDIKLECIVKMELKERLSLRCTAKAERSLVDSQKIEFYEGRLQEEYDKRLAFNLYLSDEYFSTKLSKDIRDAYESIKYIKKIGVFEKLTICVKNPPANYEQFMTDDELFTAKSIEFNMRNSDMVVPVLRKMRNGVESIKFNSRLSDELGQILAISHVQNVAYWHIQYYHQTDSLHMVAQMWIETNAKIGSVFVVSVSVDGSFEEFLKRFDDRVLSIIDKRVRIRTNNPDRHILLERGLDDFVDVEFNLQFFRMRVIPAEMKESEYDDNCKEWICKMDLTMHKTYEAHIIDGYDESDDNDDFDDIDDTD
ncbi:unnamed protein product [Caenorhabditis nigoni]